MSWLLSHVGAEIEGLNIVLLIGIAIFTGTVGAKLFQRFHIPQIVGYIATGIVLGPLVLNWISTETVESAEPFNVFALGIIGFMIGGELKRDVFTKFGKQVFTILTFEGVTAFFSVWLLSFLTIRGAINFEVPYDGPVEVKVDPGIAILDQSPRTIQVMFRGSREDLRKIEPKRIRAVV